MLKAALFDLDGTLIDTENQYSVYWGEVGRTYRPDISHFENIIKGTTLTQILDRYIPAEHQEAVKLGVDAFEAKMNYDFLPGALDFILDLKKHGVKTAVVTSSDQKKMGHFKRYCESHLPEGVGLMQNAECRMLNAEPKEGDQRESQCVMRNYLFDRILTAEDFAASKPDPDCYLRAAACFGAELNECIVFEDAFNGLEAGMRSGILTVGLATYNPAEAIKDKCHIVLENLKDVTYDYFAELLQA